ncbi:MAG: tetratricopeptide repeat protein [Planctomycetes bacterium]|nr:tetratricopeptide repeat protein [Planctomycetota bacterium]
MKFAAAALAAVLLALVFACGEGGEPLTLPSPPDLKDVEPAVAEAITRDYAVLVAEPDETNLDRYGRTCLAYGLGSDAAAVFENLITARGPTFEREYLAGRAYFLSDRERARQHFEAAWSIRKDYPALAICLGQIVEEAGELDRALELFRAADAADRSGTVPFALGRIAMAQGDAELALKELARARVLAPRHRPLLNLYVQALVRVGRKDEAEALQKELGSEQEVGATPVLKIVDPLMNEVYRQRVSFLGLVQRAEAAARAGAMAEAAKLYERAFAAKGDERSLIRNIAKAHHEAGELEEASVWYRRALEDSPRDAGLIYELGRIEFQLERVPEGIKLMNEAKDIDPENLAVRRLLAIALWNRDPRTALTHARYILRKQPDNVPMHLIVARIHLEAGREDEGRAEIEIIRKLDPDNEEARKLFREYLKK